MTATMTVMTAVTAATAISVHINTKCPVNGRFKINLQY